jgi:tungstate transport system ATP-binding protein
VIPKPLYSIRSLRKRYGSCFELAIDSLDVMRGEVFCLLGPTGAGKSTLLRLLAGLESATDGEMSFDAEPLSQELPLAIRRRIVMVHQRPHLLSGSVRYNVEYGLRIRKAQDGTAKAEAVMRRLGIDGLASQSIRQLSGGQMQLAALARAIVVEPAVLLLDEPTSNLDPARVAMVENLIQEIQRENRVTVVWTTHNLFQARRIASRIGLIWDGTLIEVAGKEKFFNSPVDARTAEFIQGKIVY